MLHLWRQMVMKNDRIQRKKKLYKNEQVDHLNCGLLTYSFVRVWGHTELWSPFLRYFAIVILCNFGESVLYLFYCIMLIN